MTLHPADVYGQRSDAHNFRNARTMNETEEGQDGLNVKQAEKKFEAPSAGNPSDSKNTKDEVIDSLRKQLNEKNLLLNKLKARAKEFVAESNSEKKKLTTAIRSLQKQLQVKVETETSLGKRVAELSEKLAELELLKTSSKSSPASNTQTGNTINGNTNAISEIESLTKKLKVLQKENFEKEDLIKNIKEDKLQLEELLRQSSGQVDFQLQALKQKLSNAEHDKETAENKKNKLKIELDSLIKQKNKMEAENRGLEAVIDKLKDEAKERKNSMKAFKAQLTQKLEESQSKQEKLDELLKESKNEHEKMKGLFNSSQENLSNKRMEVQSLKEEVEELNADILKYKTKHAILSKENEISSKEIAVKIAQKEEELKSHKKKRMTAKTEIVTMAKNLEKHQDLLRTTVHTLKTNIAPKASEQILALKSSQNKIDELIKRLDNSYVVSDSTPRKREGSLTSSQSMNSSSTYKTNKQRWQDEPGEALSNVQSEMNLAIDQINVLNAKLKVLNDALDTSQSDESYAGGSLSMKSGIRKGRSETCLSRLRKVFSNDSGRARKYAKVIDENEI